MDNQMQDRAASSPKAESLIEYRTMDIPVDMAVGG